MKRVLLFVVAVMAFHSCHTYALEPTPADRARAALALSGSSYAKALEVRPTYADCYAQAMKDEVPLVVFVGVPAVHVHGCVTHEGAFPGMTCGVVVGVPNVTTRNVLLASGNWAKEREADMDRVAVFYGPASAEKILAAVEAWKAAKAATWAAGAVPAPTVPQGGLSGWRQAAPAPAIHFGPVPPITGGGFRGDFRGGCAGGG